MVDDPTLYPKQLGNLTVAIPTILLGQFDHRQAQFFVIALNCSSISLGAPGKANRFASSSLRRIQPLTNINYGLTQIGDRQALGFK
jgi:hypothetical protein